MRILITGGAGFIGSHLSERLLAEGHEVIVLDNYFTGRKENIFHLMDNHRFELIRHDVTEPIFLEVDQIYNLACPASPVHYQYNPVKTVKTSVMGAINMLGLAKRVRARILQASTSEVYGDPEIHPQPEDYRGSVNCTGPRACYDEGKRAAEALAFDFLRAGRADVRVARIFNTYGPRMRADDGRVVSNFIGQLLSGEELTIYGDGSQTRCFCFVDDTVDGLIRLMDSDSAVGVPVNLGDPDELSIRDLAERLVQMTGGAMSLAHRALPQDDPRRRKPDISRAIELLGWRPTVKLDQGLAKTIAWFEDERAYADEPLVATAAE